MEETCILNSFSGVSSGTSTDGEEILEAVDAREFSVCEDALWDTAAEVLVDRVPVTLEGISYDTAVLNIVISWRNPSSHYELCSVVVARRAALLTPKHRLFIWILSPLAFIKPRLYAYKLSPLRHQARIILMTIITDIFQNVQNRASTIFYGWAESRRKCRTDGGT